LAPNWALSAAGLIFLTVLSINYLGDGLRDALDPRRVHHTATPSHVSLAEGTTSGCVPCLP
jgi:hypothetical protein